MTVLGGMHLFHHSSYRSTLQITLAHTAGSIEIVSVSSVSQQFTGNLVSLV